MIGVAGYAIYNNQEKETLAEQNTQINENTSEEVFGTEETEIKETEIEEPQKIRLMMLGDNLMHMGIVRSGELSDGTRNYDKLFEPIKEHLALADVKMINQETIFGGNQLGFSGYPHFNSPTSVGELKCG